MSSSPRSTRSSRGGGNSCRENARYACNYGNIRAGKCPGYKVRTRNTKTTPAARNWRRNQNPPIPEPPQNAKYYLEWQGKAGAPAPPVRGFWYTGQGQLVGANPDKLQEWNGERCLPHSQQGAVLAAFRNHDSNQLCDVYALQGREQKGCVATQGPTRGVYRKTKNTARERRYRRHRYRGAQREEGPVLPPRHQRPAAVPALPPAMDANGDGVPDEEWFAQAEANVQEFMEDAAQGEVREEALQQVEEDIKDLGEIDPAAAVVLGDALADAVDEASPIQEQREEEERGLPPVPPPPKALYQEMPKVDDEIYNVHLDVTQKFGDKGAFKDFLRPIKKNIPGHRRVWVYENKHFKIVKVKKQTDEGEKWITGLKYVGDTPIAKGKPLFLPYTGKPLPAGANPKDVTYVLTVKTPGGRKRKIDANPELALAKNKEETPWVIGLSAFANEPSPGELPNAQFEDWKGAAGLVAIRKIKRGDEILVCYGSNYNRNYSTPCGWDEVWEDILNRGDTGRILFSDNGAGLPLGWPLRKKTLSAFAKEVSMQVCKRTDAAKVMWTYIRDELKNPNVKIAVWESPDGKTIRAMIISRPTNANQPDGPQHLSMMCAKRGYGRKLFNYWLKSNLRGRGQIELDALPNAIKFWHMRGFRVVKNCGDKEPKVLYDLLRDNRVINWKVVQDDTAEGRATLKQIWEHLHKHKDDPELKKFLLFKAKKLDAVRMIYCDKSYRGWVAEDIPPRSAISSPRRTPSPSERRRPPSHQRTPSPGERRSPKQRGKSPKQSKKGKKSATRRTSARRIEVPLARNSSKSIKQACLRGYELKRMIGEGGWGTVSKACLKDDCNYAVKLINLSTRNSSKDFKRESELGKKMSQAGLGPKFYDYWHCDDVGFIITDRWDSELSKSAVLSNKLLKKLWQQIEKMHSIGLVHGDLLPKNILVKLNKNQHITDITMADFGVMDTVNEWKKDVTRLKAFYKYYFETGLGEYFQDYNIGIKELVDNPLHLDYATLYHLSENARKKGKDNFWKSIESKL